MTPLFHRTAAAAALLAGAFVLTACNEATMAQVFGLQPQTVTIDVGRTASAVSCRVLSARGTTVIPTPDDLVARFRPVKETTADDPNGEPGIIYEVGIGRGELGQGTRLTRQQRVVVQDLPAGDQTLTAGAACTLENDGLRDRVLPG